MKLTAYLHPGWRPYIRPAPSTRNWMDATPEAFAYRCLPLNIANAHGWELLNPTAFEAIWTGAAGTDAITIRRIDPRTTTPLAESIFGQGVLTFHVEAILRTPPGWNLWVGGAPNRFKDGIAPLTGVIETDWSPFTFTMNWRFTRPGHWVRFDAMEPFGFFFPVQRAALEQFEPEFAPLSANPDIEQGFTCWSQSRTAFNEATRKTPPTAPADKWQKHYYRGMDMTGRPPVEGHCTKLRLSDFDRTAFPDLPVPQRGGD